MDDTRISNNNPNNKTSQKVIVPPVSSISEYIWSSFSVFVIIKNLENFVYKKKHGNDQHHNDIDNRETYSRSNWASGRQLK